MRASRIKVAWAVPPPPAYLAIFSIGGRTVNSGLGVAASSGIDRCVALSILLSTLSTGHCFQESLKISKVTVCESAHVS